MKKMLGGGEWHDFTVIGVGCGYCIVSMDEKYHPTGWSLWV